VGAALAASGFHLSPFPFYLGFPLSDTQSP
jgi:hypothetical protein